MSYEIAIVNPRRKRRVKRASKAQIAARRRFIAKFARGRKVRRKRKARKSTSGVPVMAKRRRKRSGKRNAKGHFVKRTRRVRAKRVSRRRRRSGGKRHAATGYTIGSRRIRRRKLNPRSYRRRRRSRRNPRFLPSMSGITGQLMQAGLGAAGGLGLNLAMSYIPLPDMFKTGWGRHAARLVGALGFGMLAKKFLGAKGNAVAAGALTIVMYDIGKQLIVGASSELGARLGEFEDVSLSGSDFDYIDPANPLSSYLEGMQADDDGGADDDIGRMGSYLQGNLDGNLDGRYEEIMV